MAKISWEEARCRYGTQPADYLEPPPRRPERFPLPDKSDPRFVGTLPDPGGSTPGSGSGEDAKEEA